VLFLNYVFEIWGSHQAPEVENVRINFCKRILGCLKTLVKALFTRNLGVTH